MATVHGITVKKHDRNHETNRLARFVAKATAFERPISQCVVPQHLLYGDERLFTKEDIPVPQVCRDSGVDTV